MRPPFLSDKGSYPVSFTLEKQQNLVVQSLALDLDFLVSGFALMFTSCVTLGNLLHLSVYPCTQPNIG